MLLCMSIIKEEFQLGKTMQVIYYFVISIILLNIVLGLVFVGEPAEIHQRRLSGPPCEQK